MAGKPQERPEIRKERARRADGGEPLDTSDEMSIRWQGNSLVIGLTNYAVRTHDITADDVACVETYMDGIWIDLEADRDEQ